MITSSSSVMIMLAKTGPKEETVLTPYFCWCNLMLNDKTVLVHASIIFFFKVHFFKFVEITRS